MATRFGILAWRIPRAAEPGELPSLGSQGVGHGRATAAHTHTHWHHRVLAGVPWCLRVKNPPPSSAAPPAHAGDMSLIPGLPRCPGEGNGRYTKVEKTVALTLTRPSPTSLMTSMHCLFLSVLNFLGFDVPGVF